MHAKWGTVAIALAILLFCNPFSRLAAKLVDVQEPREVYVQQDISFAQSLCGIVEVSYNSDKVLKVGIKKDEMKEIYYAYRSGQISAYPLVYGSGIYTVTLYEI